MSTEQPVLELRAYTLSPGRRADFDRRWAEVSRPLLRQVGGQPSPVWTEVDDPDRVHYTVGWPDRQAMRDGWAAFAADPAWQGSKTVYDEPAPLVTLVVSTVLTLESDGPSSPADRPALLEG